MANGPADRPIIILGMHRSGTTMVTELLARLGLFVGAHVQGDHEATYFLDLNESILRLVGGTWDHPEAIDAFLRSEPAKKLTRDALRAEIASKNTRRFLGRSNLSKCGSLANFAQPWGFKDPRTVFTLPLWLDLWPNAKIVNVVRNGIDVAASLRVREREELSRREKRYASRVARWCTKSKIELAGYRGSSRCLELEGGFSLWESYVARAAEHLAAIDNERHEVRYEDFLAAAPAKLADLAAFCGLSPTAEAIASATRSVRSARSNAWRGDRELSAFYESVSDTNWMKQFDYSRARQPAVLKCTQSRLA